MLDWTFGLLTTEEAENALQRAGVPIDPSGWTAEQMAQASDVLDAATAEKRARLLVVR